MLLKNAAQKIHVYAYNSTTGAPVTGDAANITAYVSLDGTSNVTDTANPTQVDATNMPGVYYFSLTAAETNCDSFALYAKSATANVRIEPIIGFTTAGTATALAANAIQLGGTTQTGRDIGASVLLAADQAVNVTKWGGTVIASAYVQANTAQLAGQTVTAGAGVTFPTSVASPTNITAGTITTVETTTNLTNLPSIPANWLTAAGIAASALNGKGDWNIGKTGYSLTANTGLGNQTANITGNLSGSVGSVTTVSTGAITGGSFAAGAIDAAAFAADAEIATTVWGQALAELTTIPTIATDAKTALAWVFTTARNKFTQDASEQALFRDDNTTKLAEADISVAGGTFTRGKFRTPT